MFYSVSDPWLLAALAEASLRSCHLTNLGHESKETNYPGFIPIFASLQRTLSIENGLRNSCWETKGAMRRALRVNAAPSKIVENVKAFSH